MFTVEELRKSGAKRALLEYIISQDHSIPVAEILSREDIGEGVIVRSDHWREFNMFEGIFDSVVIGRKFCGEDGTSSAILREPQQILDYMHFKEIGVKEVDYVGNHKRDVFERYCKGLGLDAQQVLSEFEVLVQKKIDARTKGVIFEHPNHPSTYFICVGKNAEYGVDYIFFIVDKTRKDYPIIGELENGMVFSDQLSRLMKISPVNTSEIEQIIEMYTKVSSLPKFQDDFSYLMEFSFDPMCVFQMRQFRKKETSSFECLWKNEKNVFMTDTVFGLTPQEGIVLPYCHSYYPGFPQRMEQKVNIWGGNKLFDFALLHPKGFAYYSSDEIHMNVAIPQAYAALSGGICHNFSHGAQANMSHLPLYFSKIGAMLKEKNVPTGTLLRLFANGRVGYVKIEE